MALGTGSSGMRFGGSGGWDNRGNMGSSGKGASAQVSWNDLQLRRFMKDLKTEYPKELKEILKQAAKEAKTHVRSEGMAIHRTTKNKVYGLIADSIDYREVRGSGANKGGAWRIFAAPEGTGPGGYHGKTPLKSFSLLYARPREPWAYGFNLNTNKNMPVISTSGFEGQSGHSLFPILSQAGRTLEFPGIGTGNRPAWDWVASAQEKIEQGTEQKIRDWLKMKFNTMKYSR